MRRRRILLTALLLVLAFTLGACSWLQDEFLFVYHPGPAERSLEAE